MSAKGGSAIFIFVACGLALAAALSLRFGAVLISWEDVAAAFSWRGEEALEINAQIARLRLWRVLTCVVVGGGLALCGAVLQRVLRNPIADPYILGVTSGGGAFVAIATLLGGFEKMAAFALPFRTIVALAGSSLTIALLFALRKRFRVLDEQHALPVLGLILNAFFSAVLMLGVSLASSAQLVELQRWLVGSVQDVEPLSLLALYAVALPIAAFQIRRAPALDTLLFGSEFSSSLGFDPKKLLSQAVWSMCILLALLVAVSGAVGFVGLLVPHLARAALGARPRDEFKLALVGGALLVVTADLAARTVIPPAELPLGIFTALVGAPALAAMLLRGLGDSARESA